MDKPWLNNDLWPRTLRSNARKSLIAAWSFAGIWNLIAWPSVVVLPEELARGNWAALLVTLFPTVGLLLLFWSVKMTREWLKYGVTELTLDPYPGSIGGHVGGTLVIRGADARVPFEVTLECVRSHVVHSGSERKRESDVVWQARGIADTVRVGSAAEIRFRFDVPEGLPASEVPEGEEYHCWHVQIRSRQPDVDLERRFDIGVFPTRETSRDLDVDTSRRTREVAERSFLSAGGGFDPSQRARLLEEHGLEVDQQDGWLRLYLRRGRQRGMAFMTAIIGAAFVGVMVFLPDEGFSTSVMRWAFGAFGVCLLAIALYLPFNTLDVRISRQKLRRVRTWLGLVIRSQEITPNELEELEIDKGSTTTSGARTTIYYELVGRGKFGRFKLIESIPDRTLVEAIRRQVMLAAGLRPSAS